MRRVAITGLGVISALGVGVDAFWSSLLAARSGARRIQAFDPSSLQVQIAAEVPSFSIGDHLPASSNLDLLDRMSEFALIAGREALADAKLAADDVDPWRAGIAVGNGGGGITTQDLQYMRLYREGKSKAHPFTVPRSMASASASQLSMAFKWKGPAICMSTACAAAAHAIGEAAEMIRAGRADVMLAGGTEAPIAEGSMRVWEAMRVLALGNDDPARACRPFSSDRDGFVIAEGAGLVVLENWAHAVARGATIRGELAGYGATADGGHITAPGIDGPVHAIDIALAQAGLAREDIAYVNAHGTGTKLNDVTETNILKRAFGPHAAHLAVSSTKSMHGHALGATAALELIATVLAVQHGTIPPTANHTTPDPECDLDCVPNVPRAASIGAALSNSLAFGGLNAVLAVKRS